MFFIKDLKNIKFKKELFYKFTESFEISVLSSFFRAIKSLFRLLRIIYKIIL